MPEQLWAVPPPTLQELMTRGDRAMAEGRRAVEYLRSIIRESQTLRRKVDPTHEQSRDLAMDFVE